MKTMLIVVWCDGSREEYSYASLEEAREAERGFRAAFGGQVWTCIR